MKEFWIYLKESPQQFTSNHEQEAKTVATKSKNPHENPVREVMDEFTQLDGIRRGYRN